MKDSVQIMWTRVSYLADGEIVQVDTPTKLKVPVKVKQQIVVIEVDEVRLKLLEGAEAKLKNTNLQLVNLQPALSILNLGLTYSALREGLREGKVDAGVWSSIFDMAESLVFFGDQVRQLPALAELRTRLHGPTPAEANALARRFGLLGAAMALGGSATAALDNYNKRDWDAAAAEATQGVGAVLTGIGYLSLMSSAAGGPTPVGGFLLLGGGLLSIGGLVWCFFAADTPYERLAKFSAFGNDPAGATQAEGWALCPSGTFADWDPKTEAGLKLQLKAAAQLFYSFRAAGTQGTRVGPLSSDACLNVFLSAVRPNSVLYVEYDAVWTEFGVPNQVVGKAKGHCKVTWSAVSGGEPKPQFSNPSGHFEEADAVLVLPGQNPQSTNTLEVRLRSVAAVAATRAKPARTWEISS